MKIECLKCGNLYNNSTVKHCPACGPNTIKNEVKKEAEVYPPRLSKDGYSEYRKPIYKYLEAEGFEVSEKRHKKLNKLF